MLSATDPDIIVAGGGVAGTATAAALQQIGYKVLVIEPGIHEARRLAGELLHPPGVTGLAEIGLLEALMRPPAVPITGFSVFNGGGARESIKLPYALVSGHRSSGLGLEHVLLRQRLLEALRALPGITVKRGRVVGVQRDTGTSVVVQVTENKVLTNYRCRLLVGADGASSRVVQLAGIGVRKRHISTIIGYQLSAENLPEANFGHIFIAAPTTILVYPIGPNDARVLIDVPDDCGVPASIADCLGLAAALPPRLRREIEQTVATRPSLTVHAQATVTDRSVRGRVVLVGDAGGSCHPLTATGMTMCINDALLLRNALLDTRGDFERALLRYERCRRWPQATRLVLADALHGAFCGVSPELQVVRRGILVHWRASASARTATMALLSTTDGRPWSLFYQIFVVVVRGLFAQYRAPRTDDERKRGVPFRLLLRLLSLLAHHVRQTIARSR